MSAVENAGQIGGVSDPGAGAAALAGSEGAASGAAPQAGAMKPAQPAKLSGPDEPPVSAAFDWAAVRAKFTLVFRPAKPLSAAKQRERTAIIHRWLRYAIQLAFFIMAPALFSGAFNGVKYLFTQIGLGQAIEATSFLVQLVAVLGFTVVFGRFFCGYACAFGTLGDYLYNIFEFVRSKTNIPRPVFPEPLVKALSLLKYVVLAGICLACFAGVWASISSNSPWVAFAAVLAGSLDGIGSVAIGALAVVAVMMIVRERFFCQFLCPLGAAFSLMPVLGFSEFARTRAHCARKCGRCHEACPVDIWPDADVSEHGECISCGRCADTCPMANVNMVAIEKTGARAERLAAQIAKAEKLNSAEAEGAASGDVSDGPSGADHAERSSGRASGKPKLAPIAGPTKKTREKWLLLRGSETGFVIAKAAALFVLCWAVGAARYLPPFTEFFGL